MANGEDNAAMAAELVKNSQPYDIQSLLSSSRRDFLVRNNGDQVNFSVSLSDSLGFPCLLLIGDIWRRLLQCSPS
jgi:hypothetical protein